MDMKNEEDIATTKKWDLLWKEKSVTINKLTTIKGRQLKQKFKRRLLEIAQRNLDLLHLDLLTLDIWTF
jgi:hypothetical protein